ncbi:sugar efflux transporter [Actinocrispum wychmicini]|uniref:SET family sugar efflux transporter-like MFS transporter n=1 Tax=Actinocrispum wychmicini TaxID=1213861 RepID=A0A4R2J4R7_9PSEU|nr:sugar efflux transporter [Actinocrispum wychmicini]TCO53761.1 SET family sugar efflux transporter-like MFS transporter [Actinocrispum wychmicini]
MTVAREAVPWRSMVPLASVSVVVGVSGALALPFTSLFLTAEVGVSSVELGAFLLVAALAGLVGSTLLGRLSDSRAVRRNLLVIGAAAGTVGFGLYAVLRSYWALLAVACTLVAVATSLLSQMFAYARQSAERANPVKAPLIISSLRTMLSIAWVGGPPLAALLIQVGGYTALYGATALLYATAALIAARLPELGLTAKETAVVPRRPQITLATGAFVLVNGAIALCVSGLPLYVTDTLHGTPGDAGLVLGLCAALEIPLMLWFGVLAVKADQHRLVCLGAAVALLYEGVMLATSDIWQVAAAQLLHAVVISAVGGVGISYFQSLAPDRPGFATTLYTNTLTVGSMIAGPLLGLAKQLGYRDVYLMALGMSAAGVALLLGVRSPKRTVRPGQPSAAG